MYAPHRLGSIGVPLPGVECRIANPADPAAALPSGEVGELLVRGPIVMRGYRNKPEQTRETIDSDGWLHTGDVATIDSDGFVAIVDRKKELIINAAGKNMSPANIEAQLKSAHPLIGQAAVIGDNRPYNVALLVLDPDMAPAFDGQDIDQLIFEAIADANMKLSRVEQIKRWKLLADEWLPGGDELTPTMKLKRRPIAEKYAAEIEALYA
jgi:long-subunit acyl-CoA synthetase (AMP-forming)